ncbi:Zinc finger MYND domain-containing protein 10 [Nowakowskiella sp. JEL0407]|nr:Zinc finger MYND domain-containing protein 10 [Nowakowskiella sp. JEL0407]
MLQIVKNNSTGEESEYSHKVSPFEAETNISNLQNFEIDEVASERWSNQHQTLEALNFQAHMNIQNKRDEYITSGMLSFDKIGLLIHELLVIEVWQSKVFPHLMSDINSEISTQIYFVLFHEATIVNLLEVILAEKSAVLAADELLVELVDYSSRKIAYLCAWEEADDVDTKNEDKSTILKKILERGDREIMIQNKKQLDFSIAISVLSILCSITDQCAELPISVLTRILNTNNMLPPLACLISRSPWLKRKDGRGIRVFENGSWKDGDPEALSKSEAQVWLCLYNMLMEPTCQQKYDFNDARKEAVLGLRPYLNERLFNQLPILPDLLRHLEQLSITCVPNSSIQGGLLVELVPEMKLKIENRTDWKELAKKTISFLKSENGDQRINRAKKLADLYNLDDMEMFFDDPKCAGCGKIAANRCSRCRNEWYCSRQCQVGSWKIHKPICDLLSKDKNKN